MKDFPFGIQKRWNTDWIKMVEREQCAADGRGAKMKWSMRARSGQCWFVECPNNYNFLIHQFTNNSNLIVVHQSSTDKLIKLKDLNRRFVWASGNSHRDNSISLTFSAMRPCAVGDDSLPLDDIITHYTTSLLLSHTISGNLFVNLCSLQSQFSIENFN